MAIARTQVTSLSTAQSKPESLYTYAEKANTARLPPLDMSRCFDKFADYRRYIRYKNKLARLQTEIFSQNYFHFVIYIFHSLRLSRRRKSTLSHPDLLSQSPLRHANLLRLTPPAALLVSPNLQALLQPVPRSPSHIYPHFPMENKFATHTDADANDYTPEEKKI